MFFQNSFFLLREADKGQTGVSRDWWRILQSDWLPYSLSITNNAIWLVIVLTIYQVIDSVCWMKTSNSIWRPFPAFHKNVLKEELNTLIQKAISEKTKIARKYGLRNLKDQEKKEFEVSVWQFYSPIVAGVSSALVFWINIKKVVLFFCFFFRDFY